MQSIFKEIWILALPGTHESNKNNVTHESNKNNVTHESNKNNVTHESNKQNCTHRDKCLNFSSTSAKKVMGM